jgi:hypothetical protein
MTNQTVMNRSADINYVLPPAPTMWANNSYREGFFTGALVAAVVAFGFSLWKKD